MTKLQHILGSGKYLNVLRRRNKRDIARVITLMESSLAEDREEALDLLNLAYSAGIRGRRIGITGAPGAGKSTFIEALGLQLVSQGETVAVLSIDPSSRRSGGSILGDKLRMPELAMSANAFVRPSPSNLVLGGLAQHTRECVILLEAIGYSIILVETVGVGQSEVEISEIVDLVCGLVLPNSGDEVQGIKRGIMEELDIVLISKADDDNAAAAARTEVELRSALHLLVSRHANWTQEVLQISSAQNRGIDKAIECIDRFFQDDRRISIENQRKGQTIRWFDSLVYSDILQWILRAQNVQEAVKGARDSVVKGQKIPTRASADLGRYVLSLVEGTPAGKAVSTQPNS